MDREKRQWKNVTLEEFVEIDAILGGDGSDAEKTFALAVALWGEDVKLLPVSVYYELTEELKFLGEAMPEVKVKREYEVGGMVLKCAKNPEEMTTAQFFDISHAREKGNKVEEYAKLLALLLVPKGKKYGEGYAFDEVADACRKLAVVDAFAIVRFFFRRLIKWLNILSVYSFLTIRRKKKKLAKEYLQHCRSMVSCLSYYERERLRTKVSQRSWSTRLGRR